MEKLKTPNIISSIAMSIEKLGVNTIAKLTVPITIDILLNGCPLYDDNANSNIFQAVQEFIKDSNRP